MPNTNNNMTRFTIAVIRDDNGNTSILDLFSSHKTEEEATQALKCAYKDYLNAHPEKGDIEEMTWDEVSELFDEIPDSCLTAYGLSRDNTPGFPIKNVYWDEPLFDGDDE